MKRLAGSVFATNSGGTYANPHYLLIKFSNQTF